MEIKTIIRNGKFEEVKNACRLCKYFAYKNGVYPVCTKHPNSPYIVKYVEPMELDRLMIDIDYQIPDFCHSYKYYLKA